MIQSMESWFGRGNRARFASQSAIPHFFTILCIYLFIYLYLLQCYRSLVWAIVILKSSQQGVPRDPTSMGKEMIGEDPGAMGDQSEEQMMPQPVRARPEKSNPELAIYKAGQGVTLEIDFFSPPITTTSLSAASRQTSSVIFQISSEPSSNITREAGISSYLLPKGPNLGTSHILRLTTSIAHVIFTPNKSVVPRRHCLYDMLTHMFVKCFS